jgi:hypothetical protein
MTLRPQPLPPIPEATAAVQVAFPKWNLYVALRTEFGTLYDDQLFADRDPPAGRPVEVAPWRLALVTVMPYIEGLTDRQAADAVRRCTVPGLEALHWRTGDEQPPAAVRIASRYDLEAGDSSTREPHWIGYTLHLAETCDADHPDRITQVMTTPATTQDRVMGPAIAQDLADRDLLPGTHVLDSGDVDADFLVTAQTPHQIDVVGPPFGSSSRQWREGKGDDLQALVIDGEAQQAPCPQGHPSVHWRPGHLVSGDPIMRIRCDGATRRTRSQPASDMSSSVLPLVSRTAAHTKGTDSTAATV